MSWRNSQNNWKHYEEEALRAAVLSYENDNGKGQKNWNSIRDDAKLLRFKVDQVSQKYSNLMKKDNKERERSARLAETRENSVQSTSRIVEDEDDMREIVRIAEAASTVGMYASFSREFMEYCGYSQDGPVGKTFDVFVRRLRRAIALGEVDSKYREAYARRNQGSSVMDVSTYHAKILRSMQKLNKEVDSNGLVKTSSATLPSRRDSVDLQDIFNDDLSDETLEREMEEFYQAPRGRKRVQAAPVVVQNEDSIPGPSTSKRRAKSSDGIPLSILTNTGQQIANGNDSMISIGLVDGRVPGMSGLSRKPEDISSVSATRQVLINTCRPNNAEFPEQSRSIERNVPVFNEENVPPIVELIKPIREDVEESISTEMKDGLYINHETEYEGRSENMFTRHHSDPMDNQAKEATPKRVSPTASSSTASTSRFNVVDQPGSGKGNAATTSLSDRECQMSFGGTKLKTRSVYDEVIWGLMDYKLPVPSGFQAHHKMRLLHDNEWRKIVLKIRTTDVDIIDGDEKDWEELAKNAGVTCSLTGRTIKLDFCKYAIPRLHGLMSFSETAYLGQEFKKPSRFTDIFVFHSLKSARIDQISPTLESLVQMKCISLKQTALAEWLELFIESVNREDEEHFYCSGSESFLQKLKEDVARK